jgi:hypothetical protein
LTFPAANSFGCAKEFNEINSHHFDVPGRLQIDGTYTSPAIMNRHEIRIEGGGPYPIPSHDFFPFYSSLSFFLKIFYFPSLSSFHSVYFILENVRRKA